MSKEKILKFPDGFLWGAATSSHQVEGGNVNDWTEWEKKNAKRLAEQAKNHWQKWQQKKFPEMFEPKNYISGRACDHYNRFSEDFDIAKSLANNAHRFSIEWSRIEPEEGKFNEKEIEHYREVIKALRKRSIEPFVTLWHWTNPVWFAKKGGWQSNKAVKYFVRFAEKIVQELKDDVCFWITINEPLIYNSHFYFVKNWPPEKNCSRLFYFFVLKKLISSHCQVYNIIKETAPNAQVGIAKNQIYFKAYQNKIFNSLLKIIADWWWNNYFLNKTKNHQDFVGLNYYHRNRIKGAKFNQNENKEVNDLGWEIYPKGIYYVLKNLQKYQKPIYITENGLADAADEKRAKFIKNHLFWMHRAIQEGVDVRGYFYWSLLDNFEWDKGFWPRFGLVEVDLKTLERRVSPSARVYAEICKNNRIVISNKI